MTRPVLQRLSQAEIAPLEERIAAYPEVWQELARSCYCTLLGRAGWPDALPMAPSMLADLAAQAAMLATGIGADLGGEQTYIPIGANFASSERCARVVHAWRAGQPWNAIARAEKLTDRRVRQIVTAWQQETFARNQGSLDLKN